MYITERCYHVCSLCSVLEREHLWFVEDVFRVQLSFQEENEQRPQNQGLESKSRQHP